MYHHPSSSLLFNFHREHAPTNSTSLSSPSLSLLSPHPHTLAPPRVISLLFCLKCTTTTFIFVIFDSYIYVCVYMSKYFIYILIRNLYIGDAYII